MTCPDCEKRELKEKIELFDNKIKDSIKGIRSEDSMAFSVRDMNYLGTLISARQLLKEYLEEIK